MGACRNCGSGLLGEDRDSCANCDPVLQALIRDAAEANDLLTAEELNELERRMDQIEDE